MFFYIYVLRSTIKEILYIGISTDLRQSFKEHNLGLNQSTKPHRPWLLIYYEACLNKQDVIRRENLKTTQGQRFLKRRLNEYFYLLEAVLKDYTTAS